MGRLKSIFRISTLFKIATVICVIALILCYLAPYVHPHTSRLIPFFGLAYPVVIICALLLLICCALVRSKWFFFLLGVILIGGKLHFRLYSPPFGKQKETSAESFKLMSFNVKNFDVYNVGFNKTYENRNGIFKILEDAQADVICFQEFYSQDAHLRKFPFPTKDTLHILLKAKHFHSRMSFNKNYKNYFGVAMYSKFPMIAKGFIELDTSVRNSNNFCIFADIVKGNDTFRIYNTHFQSLKFQEDEYALFGQQEYTGKMKSGVLSMLRKINKGYQKRADQAHNVIKHMEQSPYPVLICGDFNDTPFSYVYNQFYSRFVDAFRNSSSGIGITYAGKVPAGRIDYIFHDQRLNSSQFKIDQRIYSDHKAISCEIWKK